MKPNIVPLLLYKDVRGAIDWLMRAFGFKKQTEGVSGDGSVAHAELRFGAGVIALRPPASVGSLWAGVRQGAYVCVQDVDLHYRRARDTGTDIAVPLHKTTSGIRENTARDLDGYLWSFGTYDMGAEDGDVTFVPELRYRSILSATDWLKTAVLKPLSKCQAPTVLSFMRSFTLVTERSMSARCLFIKTNGRM